MLLILSSLQENERREEREAQLAEVLEAFAEVGDVEARCSRVGHLPNVEEPAQHITHLPNMGRRCSTRRRRS